MTPNQPVGNYESGLEKFLHLTIPVGGYMMKLSFFIFPLMSIAIMAALSYPFCFRKTNWSARCEGSEEEAYTRASTRASRHEASARTNLRAGSHVLVPACATPPPNGTGHGTELVPVRATTRPKGLKSSLEMHLYLTNAVWGCMMKLSCFYLFASDSKL